MLYPICYTKKHMAKTFRTIRISEKLVKSCEEFQKTKQAKKLGLESTKDVIEYYVRKGIESS